MCSFGYFRDGGAARESVASRSPDYFGLANEWLFDTWRQRGLQPVASILGLGSRTGFGDGV